MELYGLVLVPLASVMLAGVSLMPAPQRSGTRQTTESLVRVTVTEQSVIRSGPHRFRQVTVRLVNKNTKSAYVFGEMRGDRFEPAGDAMVFDSNANERKSRAGGLAPQAVQKEYPERYTVRAGKELVFIRTLSPDLGGKRIKIDVYYTFDRTALPVRITTDEFVLK